MHILWQRLAVIQGSAVQSLWFALRIYVVNSEIHTVTTTMVAVSMAVAPFFLRFTTGTSARVAGAVCTWVVLSHDVLQAIGWAPFTGIRPVQRVEGPMDWFSPLLPVKSQPYTPTTDSRDNMVVQEVKLWGNFCCCPSYFSRKRGIALYPCLERENTSLSHKFIKLFWNIAPDCLAFLFVIFTATLYVLWQLAYHFRAVVKRSAHIQWWHHQWERDTQTV